jgi:hypothetical protein
VVGHSLSVARPLESGVLDCHNPAKQKFDSNESSYVEMFVGENSGESFETVFFFFPSKERGRGTGRNRRTEIGFGRVEIWEWRCVWPSRRV